MRDYLPLDLVQQCLWIVRGYERTRKEYWYARQDILSGRRTDIITVKNSEKSDPTERNALLLEELDRSPASRQMFAVESALEYATKGNPPEIREKLKAALLLSCEDGRKYTFEHMDVPGFSRSTFYRCRRRMLYKIAQALGLIFEK